MRFIRNLGLLPLFVLVIGITLIGCGGSHEVPPPAISVNFSTAPPASLQAGATAQIAANVMNDSANKGVTWSCAPAGVCGTFNPTITASGAMTTYTAPATVPAGGSVSITATSVSDSTKFITDAAVTITAPPIAVTFTTGMAPPPSINTSASVMIAANVANDPANNGVKWSCVPTNACGAFAPTQTPSGTATKFTAPVDTSGGTVLTLTATSVADPTKFISANVALSVLATLSVDITQFPANLSVQTGANTMFGATVSNDPMNKGVAWSCSDANNDPCGTFVPTSTASGAPTTYTAPAAVPQSPQLTITATSVADNTKSASVIVTIFSPGSNNSNLKGQYVFSLNGQVGSSNLPTVGSVTLDGNGNVTGGEFDQPGTQGPTVNFTQIPITGGNYTVGTDGRGVMNLSFSLNGVPGNQIPLSFALNSNSKAGINQHGVIAEIDGFISASGSLDLQSANLAQSQITGGYSFTLAGQDNLQSTPLVEGGIFTAGGAAGTLSNGTIDTNDAGVLASALFTGTFTAPDTFGRGDITLNDGKTFTYYIVTPEVLRLVETDSSTTTAGGTAYGQGSVATTNASLTGKFVFGVLGQSGNPSSGTAVVGQFTADGNGKFTVGTADSVGGDGASVNTTSLANSTYSISGSPRGTVSIVGGAAMLNIYLVDPKINLLDPNNASGGGGALLMQNDANGFSTGVVIPQANPATATFSGSYAINLTALQNQALGVDFELDLSGQATANAGKYSGLADYAGAAFNPANSATLAAAPVVGSSVTNGTFNADVANVGHFTGAVTITPPAGMTYFIGSPSTNTLGLSYYQASSTQILFIQIDGGEVAIGVLEQ